MIERQPSGIRIRERRQDRGLRQSELAARVGISPSYLNLIEHGRRRIGGKLLADIARALELDPATLGEGPDLLRLQALHAAALSASDGPRPAPELDRVQDFADRFPGWAALVAGQGRRIEALEGRVAELAARLQHDHELSQALHQVISGVTAVRSLAGILTEDPNLDRDWQIRFLGNIRTESEALAEASRALARVLDSPGNASLGATPQEQAEAWLDVHDHHLPEVEAGRVPADLPQGAAGEAALSWIRRYGEDAAALPLGSFQQVAREEAYDPARLARRLGVSLPRVLRRLSSLPAGHPPMGLVLCDASGTITHLKPIDGFPPIRAGACPLWPLFEALAQPGRGLRAFASMPGEGAPRFLCHAVATPAEEPGWDAPARMESTMLLSLAQPGTVPSDRLAGPTCRLCPRKSCPARREPSILG